MSDSSVVVEMAAVPLAFHPHDAAFNRANALFLAHASNVAYARSPGRDARELLGLDAVGFVDRVTRTRGFVGVGDGFAVLAFRGTAPGTLPNWATDAVVRLVSRDEYAGRVHGGFSGALKRSWPRVETLLDAVGDRPLFLTGHSLGGALAVLAACRLDRAGRPAVATYTFGAPRIGDPAFCDGHALPTYRVVNRLDLVPELPLASLPRLLPPDSRLARSKLITKARAAFERSRCYGHVRTLVYLDRDGEVAVGAEVEPWRAHAVARALATRGRSFHEGVSDHLLTRYIRALEGKVDRRQTGVRRRVGGAISASPTTRRSR